MKIVWNYVFVITGTALLLQLGGVTIGALNSLFNLLGITFNALGLTSFNITSNFWQAVFGSAGIWAGIGLGVIIGFFTRTSPENFVILPFITTTLYLYVSIIIGIINYGLSFTPWIGAVTGLILAPFAFNLIVALVEFFRGTDF
jgi:hypothetical protein